MRLFPSVIAVNDLLNLKKVMATLAPHCAGFHIDVMDNTFVPNLTFGPDMVNAIAAATDKTIWVHMMVANPESIIQRMMLPAGSIVTFHYENRGDKKELIESIRRNGWRPSIALNPETSVDAIMPYLDLIDHLLIMSVTPGFSGQQFIPGSVEKIMAAQKILKEQGKQITIGIDGGINTETLAAVCAAGATDVALGSYLFGDGDPLRRLEELKGMEGHRL